MPEGSSKAEYVVGVDLGGTKIYAGLFTSNLRLLGTQKMSTKPLRGATSVIDRIARCVKDVIDECDSTIDKVRAVGIGAPGPVDTESGRVLVAPNLGWENVALQKELQNRLELPVVVENDANVAMIGVYEGELEGKPRNVLGIFMGTGIGGALILNGDLYQGFNHGAGEIGHLVLQIDGPKCRCGNLGCFEALASRTAIFRTLRAAIQEGQKTVLTEMLGNKIEDMRSGDLRKAIRDGDKLATKVVGQAAEHTGVAVANMINLLSPEVVVLGGGIMEALGEFMLPIITKTALDHALPGTAKGVQIRESTLGDKAGIVGAAILARRRTK